MQRCTEALALSFFFFFTQSIHWQVTAFSNYLLSSYFPFISMDHSHSHFMCIFFIFISSNYSLIGWVQSYFWHQYYYLLRESWVVSHTLAVYFEIHFSWAFVPRKHEHVHWKLAQKKKKRGVKHTFLGFFFKDLLSRSVIQSHSNSEALFHNQMRIPEKKY